MRNIDLKEILNKHVSLASILPPGESFYLAAMKEACDISIDECAFNLMNDKEWHNAFELNKQVETIQKTKGQIK
jgi:hypothetical protein